MKNDLNCNNYCAVFFTTNQSIFFLHSLELFFFSNTVELIAYCSFRLFDYASELLIFSNQKNSLEGFSYDLSTKRLTIAVYR